MSKYCVIFKSHRWEDIVIEASSCSLSSTGEFIEFADDYGEAVGIFCSDLIAGIYRLPEEKNE